MAEPLDTVLKIWKSVETPAPFEKISIEEMLSVQKKVIIKQREIDGFEDKHLLYRMLTCSIDIKNRDIVALWLCYCKTYTADVFAALPGADDVHGWGLVRYETFYKMHWICIIQFSNETGEKYRRSTGWCGRQGEKTEETIMRYLAKNKRDYIGKCRYCGAPLPVGSLHLWCVTDATGRRGAAGDSTAWGQTCLRNSLIFHNLVLAIYASVIMHL